MSSDFRATTQYQRWTFSKAALSFRRKVAFDETENRIAAKIEEASNDAFGAGQPPAKRLKKDDEAASASEADLSLMIPPVVIDGAAHLRLVHLASRKILQLCREAKFDRAIMATALIFLRRFFINCTALEHDPEAIITAATFLAIKVEACPYLEVPGFLQRLGLTRGLSDAALVSGEIPLLVGLQYHLAVHHPYRTLRALLANVCNLYADEAEARAAAAASRSTEDGGGAASASASAADSMPRLPVPGEPDFLSCWDAVQARSFALVDVALTTDAVFLYTPAQVAAACLILSGRSSLLPSASESDAEHEASAPPSGGTSVSGWWDDASLQVVPDARVGPYLEPCVRAMIAADAPTKAVTASGTAAGAPGAPASTQSTPAAPTFRGERAKQQLIRAAAFGGSASSGSTAASLFVANPNADKLLAAIDDCIDMLQRALAGRYDSFRVRQKCATEMDDDEDNDDDDDEEEDEEEGGTMSHELFGSGPEAWKEELAALEKAFAARKSPEYIPGTKAFQERMAQAAKQREAYKAEKAAARAAVAGSAMVVE